MKDNRVSMTHETKEHASMSNSHDTNKSERTPEERIRIRVDGTTRNDDLNDILPGSDGEMDIDALVKEYEDRFMSFREGESEKVKSGLSGATKQKRSTQQVLNVPVSEDERMWAAIAHGSAIVTLVLGMLTGGMAALLTLFIPLGIYFTYRKRSEYVAYASLQAFALQLLGTVGWITVLLTGTIVGVLLIVVLVVTIVGIILTPIVAIMLGLFVLATFVLPVGMVVFGAIAAWETYQGKWYRYPWIGNWIDRQMHTGFLATI
jgi:uncharacterized Tic20 family protein